MDKDDKRQLDIAVEKQVTEVDDDTTLHQALSDDTGKEALEAESVQMGNVDEVVVENDKKVEEDVEAGEILKEEGSALEPEAEGTVDSAGDIVEAEVEVTDENPDAKWYVVHTYSGHENKVATNLRQKIASEHLEAFILDILVPTQDKIEIRGGKKDTVKEKIFPGYILVKMVLTDNSWAAVRTTPGVTGFVGIGNKPTSIPETEVKTIVKFMTQGAVSPTFKEVFSVDDTVKIIEGPFAQFIGKVDSVDKDRGKVKVLVSIFGRETPVELDFLQVQKL